MFQLSAEEYEALTFQIGRSKNRGGSCHRPYAFTEQGVAMLSSVLRSDRAVQVNIEIMRAFVRMRQILASRVSGPMVWSYVEIGSLTRRRSPFHSHLKRSPARESARQKRPHRTPVSPMPAPRRPTIGA
jgi:hypothetical protein